MNVTSPPRISVVLPVYNCVKYVREAVESVLAQTYGNFELVIVDDGSTDGSAEVLRSFSDPRIRVITFAENRGIVSALNHGIRSSRSELIARMDADDICLPQRFERQVRFLDTHPDVQLCGSGTRSFGDETWLFRPIEGAPRIHARLFFGHALDHPSIMFRRAFIERFDLAYSGEFPHAEDLDLFQRAAECGSLANLPEVLLVTRAHSEETSVVHVREQLQSQARLMLRQLRVLMPGASASEEAFHLQMLDCKIECEKDTCALARAEAWLKRLGQANRDQGHYDERAFRRELRLQSNRLQNTASRADFFSLLSAYTTVNGSERWSSFVYGYVCFAGTLLFFRLLRFARAVKRSLTRFIRMSENRSLVLDGGRD